MDYDALAKQLGGTTTSTDAPTEPDYDALAKELGGSLVSADTVDYDALATQFGGSLVSEQPTSEPGFAKQTLVGLGQTWETIKGIPDVLGVQSKATYIDRQRQLLDVYDRIDAGEQVDLQDLPASMGFDYSTLRLYQLASPEERQKIRDVATKSAEKSAQGMQEDMKGVFEMQKGREQYVPTTERFTEIKSLGNFRDWLGYTAGSVIPQLGITMAGAALAGIPGAVGTGFAFSLPDQIESRIAFVYDKVKDLPPQEQATAIEEYLNETADVTMAVAIAQGALDAFGPVGGVLRRKLAKEGGAEIAKYATKRQAAKEAAADALKREIPEEIATEGAQEIVDIAGERALGEQTGDALSKENVFRVIDSSAAGAVGGVGGGGINVATTVGQQAMQERAQQAVANKVQQEIQQKKIKENEEKIGPVFNSLVEKYKAQGATEAQAIQQAGQEMLMGGVDLVSTETVDPNNPNQIGVATVGKAEPAPEVTPEATPTKEDIQEVADQFDSTYNEGAFQTATESGTVSGAFPISSPKGNYTVPVGMVEPFVQGDVDALSKAGGLDSVAVLESITGVEPNTLGTIIGPDVANNILQRTTSLYEQDPASIEPVATGLREAITKAKTAQEVVENADNFLNSRGAKRAKVDTQPGRVKSSVPVARGQEATVESLQDTAGTEPGRLDVPVGDTGDVAGGTQTSPAALDAKTSTEDGKADAKMQAVDAAEARARVAFELLQEVESVDEAVNLQRAQMTSELDAAGITDPEVLNLANKRFDEVITELTGTQPEPTEVTQAGTEQVATPTTVDQATADTPASKLPVNPATGLKPPGKRRGGRKPLARTPEEKAAAEAQRKERQKVGRDAIRTAEKAQQVIETPFNVDDFDSMDAAKAEALALEQSRRLALVDAFRILNDKNVSPGTKAKKVAQAVVDHPSVDTRERTIAQNLAKQPDNKARFSLVESTSAVRDAAFTRFSNAIQAIDHIIKTGNAFEKMLAQRIKPFLKGVKVVTVVNPATDIPDAATREAFRGAMGLYAETDAGERVIYLNDMPTMEGTNNMTFLHEAVHGATMAAINAWLRDPNSLPANAVKAIEDMIGVMSQAKLAYEALKLRGRTDPITDKLNELDVFDDLKEFVAYGLTQPEMQDFLMSVPGRYNPDKLQTKRGLLSRFVKAVQDIFRIGPQDHSAFFDLVVVTDQLLKASSNIEPTREAAMAAAKRVNAQQKIVEKIQRSRPEEVVSATGELMSRTRNAKDAIRLLNASFDAMSSRSIRAVLGAFTTLDITRWAGDRIKNLSKINDTVDELAGMRARMIREIATQVDPWVKYNQRYKKGGRILADLMNASTLVGVDPTAHATVQDALQNDQMLVDLRAELQTATTQPTVDTRNPRVIRGEITKRENDIKLIYEGGRSPAGYVMGGWNELGTIANGQGRKIYKDVKDAYEKTFNLHQDLLLQKIRGSEIPGEENDESTPKGRLIADITRTFQEAKQIGVYFPLMRFGNFWLRIGKGKGSEFYMFESATDRNEYARRRAEELQKAGDRRSYEQIVADEGMTMGDELNGMRADIVDSSQMLKSIFTALESGAQVDPNTGRVGIADVDALKDQVYQMYLMTLPERDIRRRFTHRQGRTGFTADVIRTFITSQHTAANQLSRLAYADQIRLGIGSAYAELAGNPNAPKLSAFVDEVARRATEEMQPSDTNAGFGDKLATLGNQAVFYYMLTSIKSAIAQMTQIPIVGIPVLSSKYGFTETMRRLLPYGNLFTRFGTAKYDENGNLITNWGKPSINDSRYVNNHPDPVYRDALKTAWRVADERDLFMSTYAADMTARGRKPTKTQESAWARGTKFTFDFMSGAFHHSERVSREAMYMAAFELEYNKLRKEKVPHEQAVGRAIEEATATVYDSLFDYSQYNKPRYMKLNALTRLGTQFMTYPLQMTSYMIRNFYGMLPLLNKEGKKAAATQFFGTLGMTWMFAGTVGMPMYSVMIGFMEGLRDMLRPEEDDPEADQWYDEDDEGNPLGKRNLDLWFRETFIPTHFGRGSALAESLGLNDEQALMLQRSIKMGPISALTDMNIGSSTGLNNLWFQDDIPSESYKAAFQSMMYNLPFGPFAAMGEQVASSLDDFSSGQWNRGVEKLLPAFFRGAAKSTRLYTEGERTPMGNVIKEEEWFTIGKLLAQGAGFQSTEIAEIQKKIFLAKKLDKDLESQKKRMLDDLDRAIQRFDNNPTDKNSDAIDEALDAIYEHNYRNGFGGYAITSDTIEKSLSGRAKRRGAAVEGLYIPESKAPLILPLTEKTRQ